MITKNDPTTRPLITFALFAYNQKRFIAEAVQGAFGQTYNPLHIILSDDCSTDRTFEIMHQMAANYKGPHRVSVRQNERNLGLIGHINRVMEVVQTDLVVVASGDDISLPIRVERIYQEFLKIGNEAFSIFSNAIFIDEYSFKKGFLHKSPPDQIKFSITRLASSFDNGVNGCTHAWQSKIFDTFGPMEEQTAFEDVVIPFRSALLGKIVYIDEPLVYYRISSERIFDKRGKLSVQKFQNQAYKKVLPHKEIGRSRLLDLDLMESLYPERKLELESYRSMVGRQLMDLEIEQSLITKNALEKVILIVKALAHGTSISRLSYWFGIYLFPRIRLFKKYLFIKLHNVKPPLSELQK